MNLAAAYATDHCHAAERLVEDYSPLVKRIAYHLKGRLPDSVQVDDLIQAGMVGLLEAARNYDDGHGATFETFAGIRIRGAMLDDVRRNDWAPRSSYRKAREVAEAVRTVENREGRDAHDGEIAAEMGLELEQYHHVLREACGQKLLSFEEMGPDDESALGQLPDERAGVYEALQAEEMRRAVADAIAHLPERERLVMVLYYDEELNLREIGAVLGISESRVCQIHGQAVLRLRARLAEESEQRMVR